jgi:hypothetical protein
VVEKHWLMGYVERSIYDIYEVGFIFEPIWLKIRTAPLLVVQVSHIQFLKYTWKDYWDAWKNPFMTSCKSAFIFDHLG